MLAAWSDRLLLAALSARLLAASAARAGLRCCTLDLFADADTRAASERWQKVAVECHANGYGFSRTALLNAADRIDPHQHCGVVYGGGFESDPTLLAALCQYRPLLGNPPALLEQLRQPTSLTALLARLGIAQPLTLLTPPDGDDGHWLCKRIGGSGGAHVQSYKRPHGQPANTLNGTDTTYCYYQRRLNGRSLSATVLSDGQQARLLGVCRQLHAPRVGQPYRHAGAVRLTAGELPSELFDDLCTAAIKLTAGTGLRGLWSFDFIADQHRWWLLEINPRPGMNFGLFEAETDTAGSLLQQHLEALAGQLPPPVSALSDAATGYLIVYAPRQLRIGSLAWPDWVSDRPVDGELIEAQQPLCTVSAGPLPARELPPELRRRRGQVLHLLATPTAAL